MSDLRDLMVLVAVGVIVMWLYKNYFGGASVGGFRETYSGAEINGPQGAGEAIPEKNMAIPSETTRATTIASSLAGDMDFITPDTGAFPAKLLEDRRARAPLGAADLVPSDPNEAWSTINPEAQGSLSYQNFLEATHHFGVDTVGSSHKNANTQLRSDPPIPRLVVGPWMQSTITPDVLRKEFEIGE